MRSGAVQDAQGHRAVGGVQKRRLPLDEHQLLPAANHPVYHRLDRPGHEVAGDMVDDRSSVGADQDARLARATSAASMPACGRRGKLDGDVRLPTAQSVPQTSTTGTGQIRPRASSSFLGGRRMSSMRTPFLPARRDRTGSSPRKSCSPETMSIPRRMASRMSLRQREAGARRGSDADDKVEGYKVQGGWKLDTRILIRVRHHSDALKPALQCGVSGRADWPDAPGPVQLAEAGDYGDALWPMPMTSPASRPAQVWSMTATIRYLRPWRMRPWRSLHDRCGTGLARAPRRSSRRSNSVTII